MYVYEHSSSQNCSYTRT